MKLIVEIDLTSSAFRTAQPETQISWAISTAATLVRKDLRYSLTRSPPLHFDHPQPIYFEGHGVVGHVRIDPDRIDPLEGLHTDHWAGRT